MGKLRHADGREIVLKQRTLIGRSRRADLRLAGRRTSQEHAIIHFAGSGWLIKDLTSRNGTQLNNRHLRGEEWRLTVGDRLTFGDPEECWSWCDATPPEPTATRENGSVVRGEGSLLLLPDEGTPRAAISPGSTGWELEMDGEVRQVLDEEEIEVDGQRFRVDLPELNPSSNLTEAGAPLARIADSFLFLKVSADQEHVSLTLESGGRRWELPQHTFWYTLVLLARARLDDVSCGIDPDDAGWVYAQELSAQLLIHPERLNVDVHRMRAVVRALGAFHNPEAIVERRRTTTQLRLGIAQLKFC